MTQETALGRIIAGALLMVDYVLGYFVDVTFTEGGLLNADSNLCGNAGAYAGDLTECGKYLCDQITSTVIALVGLGANIFPALGIA